jgi:hypothetical protein
MMNLTWNIWEKNLLARQYYLSEKSLKRSHTKAKKPYKKPQEQSEQTTGFFSLLFVFNFSITPPFLF